MVTIELGNMYSKVVTKSSRVLAGIDSALAVKTPNYKFASSYKSGHWDGKTRFFSTKTGKFPTGLLTKVVQHLAVMGEEYELEDTREKVGYTVGEEVKLAHKTLGSITLRDYQYESVVKALEASRGIINVATNGGKTEIACGIIQSILPNLQKDQKIVFFTHAKEIFSQSHKRLEERLGIKVGKIGDGKWDERQVTVVMIPTIAKYIKEPKEAPKTKKLKELREEVSLIQRALRSPDVRHNEEKKAKYKDKLELANTELSEFEGEQLSKLKESHKKTKKFLNQVVGFIGDEVHHASSDTWYKVFMGLKNAYFRFGLTGTVDETQEINVMRLHGCSGKIIKKVSNEFLIRNGYSAKPTIMMMEVKAEGSSDVNYATARDSGIINCYPRNRVIANKVVERANSGKQCLIIVNETRHGDNLLQLLKGKVPSVAFSHGERAGSFREEVLEQLRDGSLRVLIATTILDEGVDVSGINCLFLAAGGKSMRQVLQRIGRGLRKKEDGSGLEVYDLLDYHNEYLVDHTMERYQTYKTEGFDIIKITD